MPNDRARALRSFLTSPSDATFAPVYRDSKDVIYTLCRRILQSEPDAMDAFQAVYSRLLALSRDAASWRHLDLERLLPRLALREAGNLKKRRLRLARKEKPLAPHHDEAPSPSGAPEARAEREQLRAELERLARELPDPLRLPIELHYFHGLSQREVARALDQSPSTVSHRIHSGLRRLERMTRKAGIGSGVALLSSLRAEAALLSPERTAEVVLARARRALETAASTSAVPQGASYAVKSAVLASAGLLLLAVGAVYVGTRGDMAATRGGGAGAEAPRVSSRADGPAVAAGRSPPAATEPEEAETARALAVRVLWADDSQPVEGATVAVRPGGGARDRLTGRTGADGQVELAVPEPAGSFELAIEHEQAKARSLAIERRDGALRVGGESTSLDAAIEVRLERDYIIAGLVHDAETGTPIPGATVQARRWAPVAFESRADGDGLYRAGGLEPGVFEIAAKAPGYAELPARIDLKSPAVHHLDFALHPGVDVRVLVVAADGTPLEGAKVLPSAFGSNGRFISEVFAATDARGEAVLADMSRIRPPKLKVDKAGYVTRYVESLHVTAEGTIEPVRVVLEPSRDLRYLITGTVTDLAGNPIRGITVEYKDGSGTVFSSTAVYGQHRAATDAAGRYRLEFEDDFEYCHLGAGGPGWAPRIVREVHAHPKGEPVVVDFQLDRGHWLEGVVLTANGMPIAGAEVSAMPELAVLNEGMAYPVVQRKTVTDAEGRFRLDDLAGPTSAVRLRRPPGTDYPGRDFAAIAVDSVVELVLQSWGVIRGEVLDAETGAPVTEFRVKIRGPIEMSRADPGQAFSSADGRFVLEHLEKDERYGLTVEASGYLPARTEEIAPHDVASDDLVRIELGTGTLIRGTVADALTGAPVSGARVTYGVAPRTA